MSLGESIYQYRTAINMSQTSLAEALDVSRQSISKWENNSATPELDKLIKMTQLFHITLDELVFGKKEPIETTENEVKEMQSNTGIHFSQIVPMRIVIGLIMMMFGMAFLLLSIFWGDHLYFGEEFGECASLIVLLISVALLGTYNIKALTICAIAYTVYSLICFGILNVVSITNYIFLFIVTIVLVIWFLSLGKHATNQSTGK